jgi:hypothetical protein
MLVVGLVGRGRSFGKAIAGDCIAGDFVAGDLMVGDLVTLVVGAERPLPLPFSVRFLDFMSALRHRQVWGLASLARMGLMR